MALETKKLSELLQAELDKAHKDFYNNIKVTTEFMENLISRIKDLENKC